MRTRAIALLLALSLAAAAGAYLLSSGQAEQAEAASANSMTGYAWSSNIGWVSMNCSDGGTCGTNDYGVAVASNGLLSGYAWSPNVGWISFNTSDLSGCPSGTCEARLDRGAGRVYGWAKVLSASGAQAGGWAGWIHLGQSGGAYGVTASGCTYGGYAWGGGSESGNGTVGWLSFSGSGYGVSGNGNACQTAQCSDGIDNNGNGVIDFANGDVRCDSGGDPTEDTNPPLPQCQDGADNDGDGANNATDPGCPTPTDTTELNVVFTATPSTIDVEGSSLLRWTATGATSCTGTGFNTGNAPNNSTGVSVSPGATATYQINCTGASGSASAQTTVTVGTPTATFTASPTIVTPGSASTLSWSTSGLASCSITGQNGFNYTIPSGSLASGNRSATNIQGRVVFTLSCTTGGGANLTRTATVTIPPDFSEF